MATSCKRCGETVTGRRYNATICFSCSAAVRPITNATARSCVVCDGRYRPRATSQLACGEECKYLRKKFGVRARAEWRRRHSPQRTCAVCSEPFDGRSNKLTCSRRCSRIRWAREHPEQVHQRRARTRNVARLLTARDWRRVLNRYGHRCAYCGSTERVGMDHVVPLSRGGRHTVGNVVPACRRCNSSKNDSLLVEWRQRGYGLAA